MKIKAKKKHMLRELQFMESQRRTMAAVLCMALRGESISEPITTERLKVVTEKFDLVGSFNDKGELVVTAREKQPKSAPVKVVGAPAQVAGGGAVPFRRDEDHPQDYPGQGSGAHCD